MDENVAKAVERIDDSETVTATPHPDCNALVKIIDVDDWQTIRARLVELEAENERLRELLQFWKDSSDTTNDAWQTDKDRAEQAEALLREIHDAGYFRAKIDAHLTKDTP